MIRNWCTLTIWPKLLKTFTMCKTVQYLYMPLSLSHRPCIRLWVEIYMLVLVSLKSPHMKPYSKYALFFIFTLFVQFLYSFTAPTLCAHIAPHSITPIVQILYNYHRCTYCVLGAFIVHCTTTIPAHILRVLEVLLLLFVTSEVLPIVSFVTDCYYPKV